MSVQLALRNLRKSFSCKQGLFGANNDVFQMNRGRRRKRRGCRNVDIPQRALTVATDTQISLGNLKQQPNYSTFIVQNYIHRALAAK